MARCESLLELAEARSAGALGQDYFALFGLPRRFALDTDQLQTIWRQLQAAVHPDRFVAAGAAQQRVAMQWSTQINSAYRTLRDPLLRAAYLCESLGAAVQAENNTAMPTAFLMRQMEWREQLDESRDDSASLQTLLGEVDAEHAVLLAGLEQLLDVGATPQQAQQAAQQLRVLMFVDKFRQDLLQAVAQTPTSSNLA